MRFYFNLQIKLFNRHIKANDINPVVAWFILLILFVAVSIYFFNSTEYAAYLYPLIPVIFWAWLSSSKRNAFLKTTFSKKEYRRLRIIENSLITLPFLLFLILKQYYLIPLLLFIAANIFSFFEVKLRTSLVIPTPFYKKPFEFIAGFRSLLPGIILAYFLTTMGILAANFNLTISGLILLILCCLSFYINPEKDFFVWVHAATTKRFLFQKIKIAFWYSLLLIAPVLITLVIFYPEKWWIVFTIQLIGFLVICVSILGKYAAYPSEFNLPQAFGIAFSILFPPLIVLILPLFYWLSLKKLNPILN